MDWSGLIPLSITVCAIAAAYFISPRFTGENQLAIFASTLLFLITHAVAGIVIMAAWLIWFIW